jgi:hypothetical protein
MLGLKSRDLVICFFGGFVNKKYSDLERRQFLIKASYLLGSVGVAPLIRAEMLYDFSKKFLPEAHAAAGSTVHHFIDLTFRAGMPLLNIGTGVEFAQLESATFSTSPTTPSELTSAGRSERPIYLPPKAAALRPYAGNLAITQGVQVSNGHTGDFQKRNGGGMGLVTPIIEHTTLNGGRFVVGGVNWFGSNNVVNSLGGAPDLQNIANSNAYSTLFTKPTLRLSEVEVEAVSEAARGISSKQSDLLKTKMKDANSASSSQAKGMDLLTRDFTQALAVSDSETAAFRVGNSRVGGRTLPDVGLALVKSLKGMENGLLGNAQITVNGGDWHGMNTAGDNSPQAVTAEYLAVLLAATMDYLRRTPSITAPGKMMSEVTLIQIQSEFTRGIGAIGSDFSDGGTDGTLLLGDMINGGYYGSFALNAGAKSGQAYGFDPITGEPTTGKRNNVKDVYNTVQNILGNPTTAPNGNVWKSWIRS